MENQQNKCIPRLEPDYLVFLLAGNQLNELKCQVIGWCGGGGGPKKNIAIFCNKQRLMSIDMKTKIVQHVKRE